MNTLKENIRTHNQQFKGISGDPELIRKEIPRPYIPTQEEIEEDKQADEVIRRVDERIDSLGHPVSKKERRKILMREIKK